MSDTFLVFALFILCLVYQVNRQAYFKLRKRRNREIYNANKKKSVKMLNEIDWHERISDE